MKNVLFRNKYFLFYLDIDKLVNITGMVIKSSLRMLEMRLAYFSCTECGFHVQIVTTAHSRINEPPLCTSYNNMHSFELIFDRSSFVDKQRIELQGIPG
jgi:DNA replication licensing factor MCM4